MHDSNYHALIFLPFIYAFNTQKPWHWPVTTFIELSVILRILTGEKTISSHSCLHLRHLLENLTSPWSTITVPCDTFLMIIKSTFYLVLVSLSTYFQWFSCVLLKVTLCAWLLPFNCCHFDMCLCRICGIKCWLPWWWWDKRSLFCWHCMGWRGISKAVAWHAPRVWPLWWCSYFWAKSSIPVLCWLPWWKWDMRTVFHLHCMGQHWYI